MAQPQTSLSSNQPLIAALSAAVFVLMGIMWWTGGSRDCERRLSLPGVETRYLPWAGCEVKIAGGEWRSEDKIRGGFTESARAVEEGARRMMESITGK